MLSFFSKIGASSRVKIMLIALLLISATMNKIQYDTSKNAEVRLEQKNSKIFALERNISQLEAIIERKDEVCTDTLAQAIDLVRKDEKFQCMSESLMTDIDKIPALPSPQTEELTIENQSNQRQFDIDSPLPVPLSRLLKQADDISP